MASWTLIIRNDVSSRLPSPRKAVMRQPTLASEDAKVALASNQQEQKMRTFTRLVTFAQHPLHPTCFGIQKMYSLLSKAGKSEVAEQLRSLDVLGPPCYNFPAAFWHTPGVKLSNWEHLRTLFATTLHGAAKWRRKASLLFCKLHCFLENGWLSKLTVYRCIFSILQFWHVREPLPPCCDSPWTRFLAWRYVQGCLLPVWYIVLSVMSAADEAYIGRNPLAQGKERENLQDVLTRFEAQQRRQKRCLATIGGCCGVTVSFPSMPKLWQCMSRISCALTCSILSCWLYPVTMLSNMYHAKMTDLEGLINVHNMERCPVPTCPTCDAPFRVQTVQCLCFLCFSWVFWNFA